MTNATILGGTLTASREDRIVSGLLLPYGEQGRTNLGKFTVDPGVFTLPQDVTVLNANIDHDREQPVARTLTLTDTSAGLFASYKVATGPEGDQLLAEIDTGKRRALSIEVKDVVIRAGRAMSGHIFGSAFVESGAFPSATLMAADVGEPATLTPEDARHLAQSLVDSPDPQTAALAQALLPLLDPQTPEGAQPADDAADAADQEDGPVTAPTTDVVDVVDENVTGTLAAGLPGSLRRAPAGKPAGGSLFARLAEAHGSVQQGQLLAALDQIIQSDADPAQVKQWLGEIYQSRTYTRRYAGLISHGDLEGLNAVGWRFIDGSTPTVGDYAGFPAQPTSTVTQTQAVPLTASRLAGAAAVDRAFVDFKVDGFWQGFYREATNDYERKIDAKVIGLLTTAGNFTAVTSSLAATPTGVARAAALIVDGAMSVINAERGLPTFAIVGSALYRDMLLTRADDLLAFLNAALGLEDGSLADFKIVPSANAAVTNKVIVGSKDAATLYELPGSPVRVDTVNVGTGGVETGLFGYWAGLGNDAKGVAVVSPVA